MGVPFDKTLCRLEDITDGEGKGFEIELDIFVVRRGETIVGYHNECPHVISPLNWADGSFMTLDRKYILCDTHGAEFQFEDGYCVSGPCMGDRLTPIKVEIRNGDVVLREL